MSRDQLSSGNVAAMGSEFMGPLPPDRDPEDIIVHDGPPLPEPEPCYICGVIATDAIRTHRYKWAVCDRCAELMPSIICALKFTLRGETGWFKLLKRKLRERSKTII